MIQDLRSDRRRTRRDEESGRRRGGRARTRDSIAKFGPELISSICEKKFCWKLDLVRSGRPRVVGVAWASATAAHTDSKREDRAIYCPTLTQFRERPFYSVVDRWKTDGRHSEEPTLWRIRFERPAHRVGARIAQYGSASADVDAADCEGGPGLHFHRDVELGPPGFSPKHLLRANDAGE